MMGKGSGKKLSDTDIYPTQANEVKQPLNLLRIILTGVFLVGAYIIFLNIQQIFVTLSIPITGFVKALGVFIVFVLLSIGLNLFVFTFTKYSRNWLRSTFIACILLIVIHVLIINIPWRFGIRDAAIAAFASFVGGIWTTWRQVGLWEDNYRPTEEERAFVLEMHKDYQKIGNRQDVSRVLFNFGLSFLGLLISSPVWLILCIAVWIEDPGPIFFVKNSVGKGGVNFRQYKFRTMVYDAENMTGPILAAEDDTRALWVGRFLRKTALDELPQLINIFIGEMAFVGPRPQRTVLVKQTLEKIPEFAERHQVLPGLAGLAQVAGDYYLTPRQKLRFDRIYVQHASLGFDIKLIVIAFLLVFYLRWVPEWNGKLPRNWLRFNSKKIDS